MPEQNQIDTSNCPQKALQLVAKVFDDGVEKYGDANTHCGDPYSNVGKALGHLNSFVDVPCRDETEIDHIKKAICRLMLALNVLCDKHNMLSR